MLLLFFFFRENYFYFFMFRDIPGCSGMFRNVPCSWFYRRPVMYFETDFKVFKKYFQYLNTIFLYFNRS